MTFREYDNKNSLRKKHTRYVQGGDTEMLGNKLGWWEREVLESDSSDMNITIISKYHKNPSLMAYDAYGKANLDWVILQFNNIVDEKDFVEGKQISLPTPDRVWTQLLSKNKKGKNI